MKRTLYFTIFLVTLLGCAQEKQTQYSVESEKVFLVITGNTTKDELSQIATEFKQKKNIDIDFSKSQFAEDGKILDLYLKVDCNDGFKGNTAGSFGAFRHNNYGFARDYSAKSETVFQIGAM